MNNEVEKLEKELDEKDELMKQLEDDLEQQDKDLEKIEQVQQSAVQCYFGLKFMNVFTRFFLISFLIISIFVPCMRTTPSLVM